MNPLTSKKNTYALLAEIYFHRIAYEYSKSIDWPIYNHEAADGSRRYFALRGPRLRFLEVSKEKIASSWDETKGLWVPEAIPLAIWQESLAEFELNKNLLTNIQNRIAPVILKHLSETEIEDIICEYFWNHFILEKPIRFSKESIPSLERASDKNFIPGNQIYYFDDVRTLRVTNTCQNLRSYTVYKPSFSTSAAPILIKKWEHSTHFFRAGMSLKDCIHIFLDMLDRNSIEIPPPKFSDFDRLVHKVEKPIYEREPENQNKNTFDRIRVYVHLAKYVYPSYDELINGIKVYRKYIDELVLNSIRQDATFGKYGVPHNFLTLSSLALKKDYTLEYIFELREIGP